MVVVFETSLAILTLSGSEYDKDWKRNLDIVADFPANYSENLFLVIKGVLEGLNIIFTVALAIKLVKMAKSKSDVKEGKRGKFESSTLSLARIHPTNTPKERG